MQQIIFTASISAVTLAIAATIGLRIAIRAVEQRERMARISRRVDEAARSLNNDRRAQ